MTQKNILFLGHDASRTGAPLLLLELVKWLKTNSSYESEVYLKRGGAIEQDYNQAVPTTCSPAASSSIVTRTLRKLTRQHDLAHRYPAKKFPIIYANTVDTCYLAMQLAGPDRGLIHHIHELEYVTHCCGATDLLRSAVPLTDAYITASGAVSDFLVKVIGVPSDKIHTIHEYPIPFEQNICIKQNGYKFRTSYGIPDDGCVIGMCGTPEWRKGDDLFVQVALAVKNHPGTENCHFVWLGGDDASLGRLRYDAAKLGLLNCCHFVPSIVNPSSFFHALDIFALTSREDPFPVAMLEAATSGVPIICFAGGGGAPELVEADAGIIVPYLDTTLMAAACVSLMVDASRRVILGMNAKKKVQTKYNLDGQGRKILAVIETVGQRKLFDADDAV